MNFADTFADAFADAVADVLADTGANPPGPAARTPVNHTERH